MSQRTWLRMIQWNSRAVHSSGQYLENKIGYSSRRPKVDHSGNDARIVLEQIEIQPKIYLQRAAESLP